MFKACVKFSMFALLYLGEDKGLVFASGIEKRCSFVSKNRSFTFEHRICRASCLA